MSGRKGNLKKPEFSLNFHFPNIFQFQGAIPLYFDFFVDSTMKPSTSPDSMVTNEQQYPLLGKNVIDSANLSSLGESPTEILEALVNKFNIPSKYHFPLFARIRISKFFADKKMRQELIYIRLLTFVVMAQTHTSDPNFLTAFFRAEPDFLTEVVDLLNSDQDIPQYIRIASIKALIALLSDNTRVNAVLVITGSHQHHGVVPTIIRRAVAALTSNFLIHNFFIIIVYL